MVAKSVTLLDSMHMLRAAWLEVQPTTIINCFRKAGFQLTTADLPDESSNDFADGISEADFETYIDIDADIVCHGEMTIAEIVSSAKHQSTNDSSDSEDECNEPTKPAEVYTGLLKCRKLMEEKGCDLNLYYKLENQLQTAIAKNTTQTSILNFIVTN